MRLRSDKRLRLNKNRGFVASESTVLRRCAWSHIIIWQSSWDKVS